MTLAPGMDATTLLDRAVAGGVAFTPGNAFYVDGGGEHTLRLSFSGIPVNQIDEGIKRLSETIREAHRQPERPARSVQPAVPLV